MAEIIKTYKEELPAIRFIGKCYTNVDRVDGGYGAKWKEWFENGWFTPLEEMSDVNPDYIGFMRCNDSLFEYWIGMFFEDDVLAPEGYDYIDLPESTVGICWIYGNDKDGSIYGMHDECIKTFEANDMGNFSRDADDCLCFFECYNCPRFTDRDEKGNVILDYGIFLKN